MAIEWTGLGPDLLVGLDRISPQTLGAQLQSQLRDAIRDGRLGVGERLPSSRQLASELGVSRGLVVDCYAQLEAEGYLATRSGSATRVASGIAAAPPPPELPPPARRLDVDFKYGIPDLASFPMRDWLWALGEASRDAPIAAAGYGDYRGVESLREVVAAYLRRVRGAVADADNVVVVAGFAQGLGIVLRTLAAAGLVRVAVEEPCIRDVDLTLHRAGAQHVPVPVDELGLDVDALAATDARVVVVTPAHQCPTGVVLAPERRHALVRWAIERDAIIIEDDYDAEFRYDRQPVGSMQGLAPDRVVTIGSVSKSLAPWMRLGWVVCPPHLTTAIALEKEIADRGSPGLDQHALAHLIVSGRYDRHLRRMRSIYGARRRVLVDVLTERAPGLVLSGLAAGFHAVLHLPPDGDETAVIEQARERSIGLHGMSEYRTDGATTPPQLVVGFGNVTEGSIRRGIEVIAPLLVPHATPAVAQPT
ncbi:MAG: PLP-dependent aminotransferase family protein [Ilumatobacteraceae bacterium]